MIFLKQFYFKQNRAGYVPTTNDKDQHQGHIIDIVTINNTLN